MIHRKAVVLRAADIGRHEVPWEQRLNPKAKFSGAPLSRIAGLERIALSRGRIPAGGESFAYHAHLREEEWILVLQGRASARIDGEDVDLGPGDFVAFPAPQAPHLLRNAGTEDLVYLMGGERMASDVLAYPDLGKQYVLVREPTRTAFHELGPAEFPFGRAGAAAPAPWRVLACKGCGSSIVEGVLAIAEIPFEREEVDYTSDAGRARLLPYNPLAQVPTVLMPDGAVMTESAAIVLHVDELVPDAGLLPRPGDPLRREALRWLVYLVASVYPSFLYADMPSRWAGDAGDLLRERATEHRKRMWQQLEAAVQGPWFLGARFSALDIYVGVMTRWTPGRDWFAANTPKLAAIAAAVDREPRLAAMWRTNF